MCQSLFQALERQQRPGESHGNYRVCMLPGWWTCDGMQNVFLTSLDWEKAEVDDVAFKIFA